jgi:ferredoxin-type protein NapH
MVRSVTTRQRVRKGVIISAFLLFPLVYNFLSPYLIIDGATQGIVNGSLISFAAMFVASLAVGRAWCGWGCPAGGQQEASFMVQDKPARGGKLNWIKWGIWIPWIAVIAILAIMAGGYRTVNPLYSMDDIASPQRLIGYTVIYYLVVGTVIILSVTAGRRAFCHYGCWMAPFMIIGRKIRNLFGWPALRLVAQPAHCTNCKKCTTSCPMSLDVNGMVHSASMENSECILCGSCADGCPKDVIHYRFSSGK